MHEIDGPVNFYIQAAKEVAKTSAADFDETIETPSRRIMVSSVTNPLIESNVVDLKTRIRIWVNHPKWPDEVVVGWG